MKKSIYFFYILYFFYLFLLFFFSSKNNQIFSKYPKIHYDNTVEVVCVDINKREANPTDRSIESTLDQFEKEYDFMSPFYGEFSIGYAF